MFGRILVPLDGSATAEAALKTACALLDRVGGELILSRVVEVSPRMEADTERVTQALREQAERYLEQVAFRVAADGFQARRVVRSGSIAETLLEVAREAGVTLVTMTTHGRTGVSRWVLGSVAERLMRSSPVPVLLVRESVDASLHDGRILLPIDGEEESLQAVPAAAALARRLGTEVLILNVQESPQAYGPLVPQMKEAYEFLRQEGVKAQPVMAKGPPAEAILGSCLENRAALIVMATHGRSGPARWVRGSVAEKVLRTAGVPVLVVCRNGAPAPAPA